MATPCMAPSCTPSTATAAAVPTTTTPIKTKGKASIRRILTVGNVAFSKIVVTVQAGSH